MFIIVFVTKLNHIAMYLTYHPDFRNSEMFPAILIEHRTLYRQDGKIIRIEQIFTIEFKFGTDDCESFKISSSLSVGCIVQ